MYKENETKVQQENNEFNYMVNHTIWVYLKQLGLLSKPKTKIMSA